MTVLQGKLVNSGSAPYQYNEENQQSFFVELQDDQGKTQTKWGIGIKDALEKSAIQNGEDIILHDKGIIEGSKKRAWEIERYERPIQHTNSIEPNFEKEQQINIDANVSKTKLNLSKANIEDEQELDLPTSVKNNYICKVKNRTLRDEKINFYEKDGEKSVVAFEDRTKSLNTSREDSKTIKAMIDVAQNKGWSSINLKGTQEFKREAWLQAQVRGIETKGYKPTEHDLVELQKRQEQQTINSVSNDAVRSKEINQEKQQMNNDHQDNPNKIQIQNDTAERQAKFNSDKEFVINEKGVHEDLAEKVVIEHRVNNLDVQKNYDAQIAENFIDESIENQLFQEQSDKDFEKMKSEAIADSYKYNVRYQEEGFTRDGYNQYENMIISPTVDNEFKSTVTIERDGEVIGSDGTYHYANFESLADGYAHLGIDTNNEQFKEFITNLDNNYNEKYVQEFLDTAPKLSKEQIKEVQESERIKAEEREANQPFEYDYDEKLSKGQNEIAEKIYSSDIDFVEEIGTSEAFNKVAEERAEFISNGNEEALENFDKAIEGYFSEKFKTNSLTSIEESYIDKIRDRSLEIVELQNQLSEDQKISLNSARKALDTSFKDSPEILSKKHQELNSVIPDVVAGKIELPTFTKQVQPDVEVRTKDASQERVR